MGVAQTAGGHDPYEALRYRGYGWFLLGSFALTLGTQIQTVALGWQVYVLTHDPLALGFVGLSEALPFLALTLAGGHVADVVERRLVCLTSALPIVAGGAMLLAVNVHGAPRQVWIFYAAQTLGGLGRAFFRPASQALSTELLPRSVYANAATWRSLSFHTGMVAGPALGGALVAVSMRAAYAAEVLLLLAGFASFLFIAPRLRPTAPAGDGFGQGLLDGVRFVLREKVVLGALSLDLFAVLFGGAPALLPIFARDILHVGEVGFGVLRAAPAAGSIVMSLVLAHLPPMRRPGHKLFACVAGFGLCWIAFGFSRSFALSLVLLVLSGALDNVSVVLRGTLVQTFTPQALMGRVAAVNSFFIGSSNEVGAFESGVAAKLLGVVPSVVFGGSMTLLVVALIARIAPTLRRLESLRPS